jgi:hypothetical protein
MSSFHCVGIQWLRRGARRAAVSAVAAALAACGGGGGSGSDAPPAAELTVSGTAATGAAVAAAVVELKCAAGAGSGTTGSDGTFSVTISGGALPCVLRVAGPGGLVLHSVAYGSGTAVRSNLTPATELIVARLAGVDPAAFYAAFDPARISAAAVGDAQAAIKAILLAAGVDFSALGDLIAAALVARTGAAGGDAYDQALDALAAALAASGNTLAGLTSAAIDSAGAAQSVASLPAELLLLRAAPTCAQLRSTTYRVVSPTPGATINEQSSTLVFDAATMTGVRSDVGSSASWVANGNCRFTEQGAGYTADVVVSRAGVLFGRLTRNAVSRHFVGFASQTRGLAELAGTWNTLGVNRGTSAFVAEAGTVTLNAEGKFVSGTTCQNAATWAVDVCSNVPDAILALIPPFAASADGGFVSDGGGGETNRLFAYRGGSGDLMLVAVNSEGAFGFYTPDKPTLPPAMGTTASNWNFDANDQLVPLGSGLSQSTNTVTSIDAAAGSWTRLQRAIGSTSEYSTTLFANVPRRGYVFRAAALVTASDGARLQLNEFTFLRMHGMGFSPVVLPGPKTFELSVGQP